MKPPDITPPPSDQPQIPAQTQPASGDVLNSTTLDNAGTSQSITTTVSSPSQQSPLALTTQIKPQVQGSTQILQSPSTALGASQPYPQTTQIQAKVQSASIQAPVSLVPQPVQPITLSAAPTTAGPTALVIIPQHTTSAKVSTVSTITAPVATTVGISAPHVALATTQPTPIQLQASTMTQVPSITTVPMTAHQQLTPSVQPTLGGNRPPSSLHVLPITTIPVTVKSEPNKYICCLLDNGVRCDRAAGNASFSARIQKIVGTKKMNFALDPTVRHAYICEHHKAIITVAKKSTTLARDAPKSNARNYTANNNPNTLTSQPISNEFSTVQQQNSQMGVNQELLSNQSRLNNNHTGPFNNISVRQGPQLAYSRYQNAHINQADSMDVMMRGSFDNFGGDNIPSCSGGVDVDLQQLQVNTLRRYKRHFRVQTRPGLNKMQLAESLKSHFRTLPIIEKEAITYFVYIVKCYRNKLDHNPKAD